MISAFITFLLFGLSFGIINFIFGEFKSEAFFEGILQGLTVCFFIPLLEVFLK